MTGRGGRTIKQGGVDRKAVLILGVLIAARLPRSWCLTDPHGEASGGYVGVVKGREGPPDVDAQNHELDFLSSATVGPKSRVT